MGEDYEPFTEVREVRWRGLTDPLAVRRQTLHDVWVAVHARRFASMHGPDSVYRGIQLAEHEIRDLWAETGDTREIGSVSNLDAPGDASGGMPRWIRTRGLSEAEIADIDAADEDD